MKIRKVTDDNLAKATALLRKAFPGSTYEADLVAALHASGRQVHDWICIHTNKAIAYIAFTTAYRGDAACGLHLAPMAVAPEFQKQGIGAEILRFALRQEPIRNQPLFVLGPPGYYTRFGFTPCPVPICPFDPGNSHFLSQNNPFSERFTIGYEPEFRSVGKPARPQGKKRK